MTPARFPHSDTPGSTLGCQLPRAYRRLLRPSSALDAKASTTCPSQLVTHTTHPPPHPQQAQDQERRHTQHATKEPHTPTTITAEVCTTSSQPPHPPPHAHRPSQKTRPTHTGRRHRSQPLDARVHYPDLKQQTPHPTPSSTRGITASRCHPWGGRR